jgi:DNA-binding XRE family transcriptional regulator
MPKPKNPVGRPKDVPTKAYEVKKTPYESEINRVIRERIKRIRIEANLTQEKFAESLNSNLAYIKAIEQGKFTPSNIFLNDLANTYRRSLDWIFGRIK